MKIALKLPLLALFASLALPLLAQIPQDPVMIFDQDTAITPQPRVIPVNDVVEKRITAEKRILPYDAVREADIMWEKRVWRVIDIREKMNLPFAYPERQFFTILHEAAVNGEVTAYGDDKFETPKTATEVATMGASVDTISTFDPVTYEETIQVVTNELNPDDIKRYRISEIWYFDEESSTLKVRILGISPLKDEYDENGNFLYELPMFWIYYPEARSILARENAYAFGNDAANRTWEDVFEARFFSSYIYKESNVHDRRLQDYMSGIDKLMEADKIKTEIFNFEHDLWEY